MVKEEYAPRWRGKSFIECGACRVKHGSPSLCAWCLYVRERPAKLHVGDKVKVVIEGTIDKISRGHGECYKVTFPQLDFTEPRVLMVNPEEIEE